MKKKGVQIVHMDLGFESSRTTSHHKVNEQSPDQVVPNQKRQCRYYYCDYCYCSCSRSHHLPCQKKTTTITTTAF